MTTGLIYRFVGFVAVAIILTAGPGCRKEESAPGESATEKAETGGDAETTAAVEAKLVAADEFDGTSDKIVSKCPGCALKMDGKSEHALEVSGYTLYFCSEECKTRFAQDTTKALLDLQIPQD